MPIQGLILRALGRIFRRADASNNFDLFALGSILLGFATPAEAAAMGAFGAILLSLIYRKFTFSGFFDNLIKSLEITVLIMFLVAASNFFGAEFSSLGTQK